MVWPLSAFAGDGLRMLLAIPADELLDGGLCGNRFGRH